MIVLEESASGNTYNVTVVNETTNTEVHNVDTTSIAEQLYYNTYTAVFNLKEDVSYTLTIKEGSEVKQTLQITLSIVVLLFLTIQITNLLHSNG